MNTATVLGRAARAPSSSIASVSASTSIMATPERECDMYGRATGAPVAMATAAVAPGAGNAEGRELAVEVEDVCSGGDCNDDFDCEAGSKDDMKQRTTARTFAGVSRTAASTGCLASGNGFKSGELVSPELLVEVVLFLGLLPW